VEGAVVIVFEMTTKRVAWLAGAVREHISVRQVRGVRLVGLQYTSVAADDRMSAGGV